MISSLFNEAEADAIVKANISKHNLEEIISMRLFKSDDGQVFKVVEALPVSREELVDRLQKAQAKVSKYEKGLADYENLTTQSVEQPEQSPQIESQPQPEQLPESQPETPTDPIAPIQ